MTAKTIPTFLMPRTPDFQALNTEVPDGAPVTAQSDISPNGQKVWFVYDGYDADTRTARRLVMANRLPTALRRVADAVAQPTKRKRATAATVSRDASAPTVSDKAEQVRRAARAVAMSRRLTEHPGGAEAAANMLDAYADMLLGR